MTGEEPKNEPSSPPLTQRNLYEPTNTTQYVVNQNKPTLRGLPSPVWIKLLKELLCQITE